MKAIIKTYGRVKMSVKGRSQCIISMGDLIFLSQFLPEFPPELFFLRSLLLVGVGNATCKGGELLSVMNSVSSLRFGLRGISFVIGVGDGDVVCRWLESPPEEGE